jgi:HSP20 family protein
MAMTGGTQGGTRRPAFPFGVSDLFTDFEKLLERSPVRGETGRTFPLDVSETDGEYFVTAELPGVKETDIELLLDRNVLTITVSLPAAERESDEKLRVLHRERRQVRGSRTVTLPLATVAHEVEAHLSEGLLHVRVKKEESQRPKRIAVVRGGS